MILETKELGLNFGLSTDKLLEELNENFPVVNPHPDDPVNLIMYRSGQRSVVEWINHRISEDYNG